MIHPDQDILYAPEKYGGLQVKHQYYTQVLEKNIHKSLSKNHTTGKMKKTNMQHIQMLVGTSRP